MEYKQVILGIIFGFLLLFVTFALCSFFDGQDNKQRMKNKIYMFFYSLGNKLYVRKQIKNNMKQIVEEQQVPDELLNMTQEVFNNIFGGKH